MVWVVTYAGYGAEITEVIGVATSEEVGRQMATDHHEENRDPKVSGPLNWDERGVSWNMARGRRYTGYYDVEEFPVT